MSGKLMIPGPVEVRKDVLDAQTRPMIGHRAPEYVELQRGLMGKLRKALEIRAGHLFLVSSSGTGGMEAGARNLVSRRVLSCTCGAFSERWYKAMQANGKEATPLSVDWGKANHAEAIEQELRKGGYDAIHVTHSETSTGVLNRLEEIGQVLKSFPDVIYMVDAVSSMAGVPIRFEEWGIDFIFAGTQKAWGLPPGLCIMYASEKAIERAKSVENRGFYFDLPKYVKSNEKDQTPETPPIALLHALDFQLDRMLAEGMPARFERNLQNAVKVRAWGKENGFEHFAEPGYEGVTLTCLANTRGIDLAGFIGKIGGRGYQIGDGYGKLKGKAFRIAHMADLSAEDIDGLLSAAGEILDS